MTPGDQSTPTPKLNLYSLDSALILLLVLGTVIPTGAALTEGGDRVWDDRGVYLIPHDGPNGAYAAVGSEGNLSIDLATVGVNANALTSIREVFDVANYGEEPSYVWITHDASETVRFTVEGGSSIQDPEGLELRAGERRAVSIWIDTTEREASDEPLLRAFRIHVAPVPDGGTAPGGGTGSGGDDSVEPPPARPVDRVDGVEVIFDDPGGGPVGVRELTVEDVERLGGEDDSRPPRAVIDHTLGDRSAGGNECPCADDARLRALGVDALVEVNEVITFRATRSLVGSMRSVDPERRMLKIVDIEVPPGRRDSPATVRMRVDEDRFAATGLSRPRVARKTEGGWQMLPTRVVGRDGGQLILEARTPGFSVFAVFATNGVQYVWQVDGQTIPADEIRHEWETPGLHNVSLTVRDAFGRADTATYQVLVNDPPSVAIETPANLTAGRPVTLRANVTNDVGNVTVNWLFPDGSRQTGTEVEHVFGAGRRPVRVEVEDEYGSTGAVERSLDVAPAGGTEPIVDRIAGELPTVARLLAVALLSLLLVVLLERLVGGGATGLAGRLAPIVVGPFRNRPPRIVAVDSPTVDVRNRRFDIDRLRVEDPDGNLETVELRVLDRRGMEVAHKSIDLRGRSEYVSRGETVLPKSRVYVRPDDEYTVEVSARDAGDRWARRRLPPIRGAGAVDG